MKFNIWGAEESWLVNYLNARAIAKIEPSEKDLQAFHSLREQDDKRPKILKIKGDSADIQISGSLSQGGPDWRDYFFGYGGTSYREIIASVKEIKNNSQIKNVNLLMDTPGGRMKGLDNVWKELMSLRKDRKIIAINHGLLASAGYYLASAAHKIQTTSETNEVGSIGVLVAGTDWSKYDKKLGIEEVVIVSKNAPDKHVDIGTDKGKDILQERVDTFERFFLERISAGRGLEIDFIKKNFGRGGLLISKNPEDGKPDALSVKMIDKVLNISQETGAAPAPVNFNAKQEKNMTLAEFLAANPDIKAELDRQAEAKVSDAFKAGEKKGKEEVEGRVASAMTFMGEESPYFKVKAIQKTALQTIKGEVDSSALQAAVAGYDAALEGHKSTNAKEETDNTPETPGGGAPDASQEKIEKFQASVKKMKEARGMK